MAKKLISLFVVVLTLSISSSAFAAQSKAVGGSNPTPQAVGGSNPTPQAVGGSNPDASSSWRLQSNAASGRLGAGGA